MNSRTDSKISGYLIGITIVAALGGLLFGYDTAVIAGTVGSISKNFVAPLGLSGDASANLEGFIVSSALIGCIIGGFLGGPISKNLGRKKGLILAAVLFFISALGSAWPEVFFAGFGKGGSEYIWHFVTYRVIGGIGVGLASMLSPMYIAEVGPSHIRGKLVSLQQLAIIFGAFTVSIVNYFIGKNGSDQWLHDLGWRYMFASELIPAGLFLLLALFIPESPRWLMTKKREDEAREIITKIDPVTVDMEIAEIKESLEGHQSGKLFSFGKTVVVIGIVLSLLQQFVGVNSVLYYAPEIFKSMGADTSDSLMQTILVMTVFLVFTVVAIVTVDKFGRKPLLIIGSIIMGVTMIALGTTFYMESLGLASLIFILLYIAGFAMSWGPVVWVLLAEIFPNQIRSKAMAIAVAAQWLANLTVSWTFPMITKDGTFLGDMFNNAFAYWVYGAISIGSAIFVMKLVPETKGISLEEMENLWDKDSHIGDSDLGVVAKADSSSSSKDEDDDDDFEISAAQA